MIDDNNSLKKLNEILTAEIELDDDFEFFEDFDKEDIKKTKKITNNRLSINDAKEIYAWCIRVEHAVKRLILSIFTEILDKDHDELYFHKINKKLTLSKNIEKAYVKYSMTLKLEKNCKKCKKNINNGINYGDFGLIYEIFQNIEWNNFIKNFDRKMINDIYNVKELRHFIFHLRSENIHWKEIHNKIKIVKLSNKKSYHDKIQWFKGLEKAMISILNECISLQAKIRKNKKQVK